MGNNKSGNKPPYQEDTTTVSNADLQMLAVLKKDYEDNPNRGHEDRIKFCQKEFGVTYRKGKELVRLYNCGLDGSPTLADRVGEGIEAKGFVIFPVR